MKFIFVRDTKGTLEAKTSKRINDFKKFCHYVSLMNWEDEKEFIMACLLQYGQYQFTGNDIKYYIFRIE